MSAGHWAVVAGAVAWLAGCVAGFLLGVGYGRQGGFEDGYRAGRERED